MASNQSAINTEDVINLVLADPRLEAATPAELKIIRTLAELLVEVVGPERRRQPVTAKELFTIQADLLAVAVYADLGGGPRAVLAQGLYIGIAMKLRDLVENYDEVLVEAGLTDEDVVQTQIGLTAEHKALAAAGKLTFGDILLKQPVILFPPEQ